MIREQLLKDGFTVKNKLLWKDGEVVDTITADEVANKYGYVYVEQLILAVERE